MEEIVKNEFEFYSRLAKPLVLNLPKSKDRILAAAWIKKFRDENSGDELLRTTYLKLLLFSLQRRRLSGIFADDPLNYSTLEDLPPEIDLNEFARNIMEQEKVERAEVIRLEMMGDMDAFPAYTTDCSPDLTEYVAAQDIPNFGVHAYYAISKQPINKWQRSEKAILPKGCKSAIETTATAAAAAKPLCVCAPPGTASAPEAEEQTEGEAEEPACRKKKEKPPEKKKRRPKKLGASPPSHPIGEVKKTAEDRITPTWGTNLLEVRDHTQIGHIEEPSDNAKALEEEVSKLLAEAEDEDDDEQEEAEEEENLADKSKEMIHIVDEFKHGKMDKPKPPSRLAKLGDKSGIRKPKSVKEPKIPVKGMKKGKGKGKGGYGPKPANLPSEYDEWTEKDLEEAGLTWKDLLPVDENIDDELQRLEDEGMAGDEDDLQLDRSQYEAYDDMDLDAMLREAEEDLAMDRSVYEEGVEEDEPIVELFDDELEELEDQLNASRAANELQTSSPAITSGIAVTTPHRSASPRRFQAPEKVFAEEDDDLLEHRYSPLRAPKVKRKEPKEAKRPKKPSEPTDKDPNISKVFKHVQKHVKDKHDSMGEDDEFEMLERQFQQEAGGRPCPSRNRSQSPGPGFSPGAAGRVQQRAQEQEQYLRNLGPPGGSPQGGLDEFERLERQFQAGGSPCARRGQSPGRGGSPGDASRVQQRAQEQEQYLRSLRSPRSPGGGAGGLDEFEMSERQFQQGGGRPCARRRQSPGPAFSGEPSFGELGRESPYAYQSPGPLSESQEFEMLESMYQQQSSPQAPGPMDSYLANESFPQMDGSLGLDTSRGARLRELDAQFQRNQVQARARYQEALLRQGSPQANEIIRMVERSLDEDMFKQLAEGEQNLDESPPPDWSAGPHSPLPERQLRSPTTGAILDAPQFDVQPEDLGEEWEDDSFGIIPGLYQELPDMENIEQLRARLSADRKDIFVRCGGLPEESMSPPPPQEPSPQQLPSAPSPCPGSPPLRPPPPPPPMPFYPGISSPRTPPRQFPERRPYGFRSPETPPMQGPDERPEWYPDTPELDRLEISSPLPYREYVPYEAIDDADMPDFDQIPPDSPRPCTPRETAAPSFERAPTPARRAARRRPPVPEEAPSYLDHTPVAPRGPKRSRKLFGDGAEGTCEPCGPVEEPPEPCGPCGPDGQPEKKRHRHKHRHRSKERRERSRSPGDDFEEMERQFAMEETQPPCGKKLLPDLPGQPGEAARVQQRAREQLDITGERMDRRKVVTPPPCSQRTPPPPSPIWSTPEWVSGPSRRPTGKTPPVYDSDFSPPPSPPPSPKFAPAKRIKKKGKYPTEPILQPFSPGAAERVRQRAQEQEMLLRGQPPPPPSPDEDDEFLQMERQFELEQGTTCQSRQPRPPQPKTPCDAAALMGSPMVTPTTRPGKRGRKLFVDDIPPKRDRRKVIEPPPAPCARTPPPSSPVWSTPEGVAGPSRRPTGLTPPVYDSDFSPPPTPVVTPKFPPARRIPKRGRNYPPPVTPRTPTDERRIPCGAPRGTPERMPICGGETPTRGLLPLERRRLFDELGRTPTLPEKPPPPAVQSPWDSPHLVEADLPFDPLIDDEEPPEDFAPYEWLLKEGQMYFPPEELPVGTPEGLPTRHDLKKHTFAPDRQHRKMSSRTPFGQGPGAPCYRESVDAFKQMPRIPEYESDQAYREHLINEADLETLEKYYRKPPSGYLKDKKSKHYTCPPQKFKSPPMDITREPMLEGYGDIVDEIYQANKMVPPEMYPSPVCRGADTREPAHMDPQFGTRAAEEARYERIVAASDAGGLKEHLEDLEFEDIAGQMAQRFQYEGGLLDISPPPDEEFTRNYYPDITQGVKDLVQSIEQYDLPDFPVTPPQCRRGAPPMTPPSVPPGSPRTPPLRMEVAPAEPVVRTPCGAGKPSTGAIPKKPAARKAPPPKPLKETKSSQLRKEKLAQKQQAEKEAQLKKEQEDQARIDRKKRALASRKAERKAERKAAAEAKEAKSRAAREYPDGKMRPKDYVYPKGSALDDFGSAKKADEGDLTCVGMPRKLFDRERIGNRRMPETRREVRKTKGRKGPGDPHGVCGICDDDDDDEPLAMPLEDGPEFMEELREHQVDFPGYDPGVVVKGRYKRVRRRSRQAIDEMDVLGEEQRSPCGPCGQGEYESTLRSLGLSDQEPSRSFSERLRDRGTPQADALSEFERLEQAVIQREREEREYFERLARGEIQEIEPITEEDELAEFEELERQAAAEVGEVCPGAAATGTPDRMTYSPPRPTSAFGEIPYTQPVQHLPMPSPPRRSPTCPPTPPSPPPMARESEFLDFVEPPVFQDMPREDRLPFMRADSPPPSPLIPSQVRHDIRSMARPTFDPALRGGIRGKMPKPIRTPCGMPQVQEEEPLIPELVGQEPFRGEDARARRRRLMEGDQPQDEMGRYIRNMERTCKMPRGAIKVAREPLSMLDELLPEDLPPTMSVPFRQSPSAQPAPPPNVQFTPPTCQDFYVAPDDMPIHPDLVDLVDYEPPMDMPEDMDELMQQQPGEELFFTPPRYPETDEMELDREALLRWQPPYALKNLWLASPGELGMNTPPSVGKGPCGTYTPTATPPPMELVDSLIMEDAPDEAFLTTPPGGICGPMDEDMDSFLERTPPLETVTSLQEMQYRTWHAKGRAGIKPKPQFFGGYGETPQRPIPRWYGRGGARDVIQEVEEPFSPPTPGTPPPQFPEPPPTWSPTLDEFERLEQEAEEAACRERRPRDPRLRNFEERQRQMMIDQLAEEAERMQVVSPCQREFEDLEEQMLEEEAQSRRPKSKRHRQRLDFEEMERKATMEEMAIEAERMQMEFRRPPSPTVGRQPSPKMPSPSRTPPPCAGAADPFMRQADFIDEQDFMAGYQSPEPLSDSWREQANLYEMDSPMFGQMDQAGVEQRLVEDMGFDLEGEQLDDIEMLGGYDDSFLTPPRPRPCQAAQPPPKSPQTLMRERELHAERERQELHEMFAPSPGPISPGPGLDFFADVYSHHVPEDFLEGDRPRCMVMDQRGNRDFMVKLKRHQEPPALEPIGEPRVRIQSPQQPGRRGGGRCRPRSASAPRRAPQPPPQVAPNTSAQRIAEARKHYQQTSRVRPRTGEPASRAPCGGTQPALVDVNEYLQGGEQQQEAAPCQAPVIPQLTAEEAQRRARERIRASRRPPPPKAPRQPPPPPPPQPFTGFLPTQVQMRMPRAPPQEAPVAGPSREGRPGTRRCGGGAARQEVHLDDFMRGGPAPGSGPQAPQQEPARRQVRKTSSLKKIVTKRN